MKCSQFPNIDTSHCEGRFRQVVEVAKLGGLWLGRRGLRRQLMYLATYASRRGCIYDRRLFGTRCTLYNDFAPLSFGFQIEHFKPGGGWVRWFSGGLIYSGPGVPLDGSAPALTVSLSPHVGWSVHT